MTSVSFARFGLEPTKRRNRRSKADKSSQLPVPQLPNYFESWNPGSWEFLRTDLSLIGDGSHRLLHRFLIPEVELLEGLQLVVEEVDERNSRRNVQLDDLLVGDVFEVLHQRPQAVAVRGDQHP